MVLLSFVEAGVFEPPQKVKLSFASITIVALNDKSVVK